MTQENFQSCIQQNFRSLSKIFFPCNIVCLFLRCRRRCASGLEWFKSID